MSEFGQVILPGLLSDNDIKKAMKNNELVICPYNEKQLTPVGYNLTFTKFIFSVNNKLLVKLSMDKKTNEIFCIIEPNDTVLILTQEAVWVSESLAGTFHSKVGIVSKGFGHISTTLDPNWEGPLLISLNNPTKEKITLVIGKDEKDGIKYNSFVTLILYRMVSKAEGKQDNLPSRVEILKDTKDNLGDHKKYKQLINIIDKIRNFESLQVGIGKVTIDKRLDKIQQFKNKYLRFANDLNGNIDQAYYISASISKDNIVKYTAIVISLFVVFVVISFFGIKAYKSSNSNLLSLLAIITALYIQIFAFIENISRKKLL